MAKKVHENPQCWKCLGTALGNTRFGLCDGNCDKKPSMANEEKKCDGYCAKDECVCPVPLEERSWESDFEQKWKNNLIYAFGYKNPDDGMQRKVIAEQVYSQLKVDIEKIVAATCLSEREKVLAKATKINLDLDYGDKREAMVVFVDDIIANDNEKS